MLKKLAKYGNSTTLVIDKAILELLDMKESSIVKLKIDGPSLIITPVSALAEGEKISYSSSEAVRSAHQAMRSQAQKIVGKGQQSEGEKAFPKMQKEFQELFKKHKKMTVDRFHDTSFMGQEYQEAVEAITQKIDPATDPEGFGKEVSKLNEKFHPELADFNKDMQAIVKKYKHLK